MLESMTLFAKIYDVQDHPVSGMWLLYVTISLLCIFVYRLGFARKLNVLQNIVIYFILVLGCSILTFFAVFLPVGEGLLVAIVVLSAYKIRLHQFKKQKTIQRRL
ncbi:YlaH-like family protein [Ectobacillus sp. sgz5001026]|uniref:YlaH-like family protein n=1 Tax=Ectobacillus sp. sgz5001026 TaxID=3242473 RepID=UPI0036D239A1